jgi:hypothetical protein
MQVRLIVPWVKYRHLCTADCLKTTGETGCTHKIGQACCIDKSMEYAPRIASIAGGFTAFPAVGGWVDAAGKLIVEPVTVFDCFDYTNGSAELFRDLARRIRQDLNQDCVYLSIDGEVEFVK